MQDSGDSCTTVIKTNKQKTPLDPTFLRREFYINCISIYVTSSLKKELKVLKLTPDLLNQNLPFNKIPRRSSSAFKLEKH